MRFIKTVLVIIISVISIVYIVARPQQPADKDSQYLANREYLYSLLQEQEIDASAFKQFLVSQADFKPAAWPQEFWYSINFSDPRGNALLYQDIMMGLAIGIKRLYKQEEPTFVVDRSVVNILNKRSYLWHGFSATNFFAREYAALAALAYVVGDTRFPLYKYKLHRSLSRLFAADGTPLEGPTYGLYTMRMLAPYVYLTQDKEVRQVIDNFRQWLTKTSYQKVVPPLEDSPALNLPPSLSSFAEVNRHFVDWKFPVLASGSDSTQGLTTIRKERYSVWLRHRQNISPFNSHQQFSSLDILLKTPQNWWLVSSGYPGWSAKFDQPYLHNVATNLKWLDNDYWWRVVAWLKKDKPVVTSQDNLYVLSSKAATRKVKLFDKGITVNDYGKGNLSVIWNVKGRLLDKQTEKDKSIFIWQQGQEKIKLTITGNKTIVIRPGRHALTRDKIEQHTVLILQGKNIISTFELID